MRKFKKFISVLTACAAITTTCAMPVNAAIEGDGVHNVLFRRGYDSNTKYGFTVRMDVETTLYVDVGWVTDCYVKSKGISAASIKRNGGSNKCSFKYHTILAHIGGLGGGSLSVGATKGSVNWGSCEVSRDYSGARADYAITSNIWRLYQYYEIHDVSYIIKDSKNIELTTLEATARISY